jgi:hypothetical protein
MDYIPAPKDVRSVVKEMRAKYYHRFDEAKITTLMRLGKWDKWGTLARVGLKQRMAGIDADYILTLNGTAWPEMTDKQQHALVDHELLHMKIKKTKAGKSFVLRHHDVEEFIDIAKRYGGWSPNLKALGEVLAKKGH